MDNPANTMAYMILGYGLIFGAILGYLASLLIRQRKLRQEEQMLEDLEKNP